MTTVLHQIFKLPIEIIDLIVKNNTQWLYYLNIFTKYNYKFRKIFLSLIGTNYYFKYRYIENIDYLNQFSLQKKIRILLDFNSYEGYHLFKKLPKEEFINIRYFIFDLYDTKLTEFAFIFEDIDQIEEILNSPYLFPFIIYLISSFKLEKLNRIISKIQNKLFLLFVSEINEITFIQKIQKLKISNISHFVLLHRFVYQNENNIDFDYLRENLGKFIDYPGRYFNKPFPMLQEKFNNEKEIGKELFEFFKVEREQKYGQDYPENWLYTINVKFDYSHSLLFAFNGMNLYKKYQNLLNIKIYNKNSISEFEKEKPDFDYLYWVDMFNLQVDAIKIRQNYHKMFKHCFSKYQMLTFFGVEV